jgi:hypothetical protein
LDLLTRVKQNFGKKYSKDATNKLESYYESIDDMKLYNWIKCQAGELKYARIEGKGTSRQDKMAWERIYDSYLQEYGLTGLHKKAMMLMKEIALIRLEYVITQDRRKLTDAEIKFTRMQTMLENSGVNVTIDQTLIHLSKWLGTFLDSKNITVRQYFNLIEEYGKANKG